MPAVSRGHCWGPDGRRLVQWPSGIAYSGSVSARRILVVDDQPMLCKAIRRMLAQHDVATVGSAQEAVDKVAAGERYDVILTDLMMPGMSGMELHAAISQLAPDQVSRMVFMTGGAFTPTARQFFEHVACPTLEKPFDKAGLLAILEPLLA
jgi:CheY-like chemotaxis protein